MNAVQDFLIQYLLLYLVSLSSIITRSRSQCRTMAVQTPYKDSGSLSLSRAYAFYAVQDRVRPYKEKHDLAMLSRWVNFS